MATKFAAIVCGLAASVSAGSFESRKLGVNTKDIVPKPVWSEDGKSLWIAEADGDVRVFSVPEFQQTASVSLDARITDFGLSKDGPIVLLGATQFLVHLDHNLKEVKREQVPGVESLTTAVTLSHVFLVANANIAVWDLKRGRIRPIPLTTFARTAARVKRTDARPAQLGFRFATCSPDGEFLFAAPDHRITRYGIRRGALSLAEQGWKVGTSGTPTSLHVGAGRVALLFGTGNSEVPGHPKTNFGSYVYESENLRLPKTTIESGAWPTAIGFDTAAGLVYAQNSEKEFLVFNEGGTRLGAFDLGPKQTSQSTSLILPHPDGGKALVLTKQGFYWCIVPDDWITRPEAE